MKNFVIAIGLLLSINIYGQTCISLKDKHNTELRDIDKLPIPRTLERCFYILDKTMSEYEKCLIKTLQEDSICYHSEFKFGADFFHAWKIYDGSRLTKYFNKQGLAGSHEIYETVLISYHRYLNDEEIKLREQISKYQELQKKSDEEYVQKLEKDTINGIYIPKDLNDCFLELDKLLSDSDKNAIKNLKGKKETIQFHHSLGMWLRNNWELWGGSRLQKYFSDKKFNHPDDISAYILEEYYEWLNK